MASSSSDPIDVRELRGVKFSMDVKNPQAMTSGADQVAITDSTGGTKNDTFAAITAGVAYAQADLTAIKNALATIAAKYNNLRTTLVANGMIKGSA